MTLRGIYTHLQPSILLKRQAPWLSALGVSPWLSALGVSPFSSQAPPRSLAVVVLCNPQADVTFAHWKFGNSSTWHLRHSPPPPSQGTFLFQCARVRLYPPGVLNACLFSAGTMLCHSHHQACIQGSFSFLQTHLRGYLLGEVLLIDLVPPPLHLPLVNATRMPRPLGRVALEVILKGAALNFLVLVFRGCARRGNCCVTGQAQAALWWVTLSGVPLGRWLDQFTLPPAVVRVRVLHMLTNRVLHLFLIVATAVGVSWY